MIYTYLMDTKEQILEGAEDFCKGLTDAQDETAREILSLVADKWPLWVMQVLGASAEPVRFSRVMERVDGISQKVLTHTLRRLEREGLCHPHALSAGAAARGVRADTGRTRSAHPGPAALALGCGTHRAFRGIPRPLAVEIRVRIVLLSEIRELHCFNTCNSRITIHSSRSRL